MSNSTEDGQESQPSESDSDPVDEPTEELIEQIPESMTETEDELVEDVTNALNSEGFGVFRGREFVTVRGNNQIAPNSTVSEQYLDGMSAAILGYDDSTNEIAIIPLKSDPDRPDVYSLQWNESKDRVTISASGFLKEHNIDPDQTIRYSPEWNESIGGDHIDGALILDMDSEGEVAPGAAD